jgi:hypothetical protein
MLAKRSSNVENDTVQKYVTLALSECRIGAIKNENHMKSTPCAKYQMTVTGSMLEGKILANMNSSRS